MKHNHSILKIFAAVICVGLFFAGAAAVFGLVENLMDKTEAGSKFDDTSRKDPILHNGVYFAPKKKLDTLLLLCVDRSEDRSDSEEAVFLALLIADAEQKSFTLLHIDPDTVAAIPSSDGDSSEVGRIASAYTYGSDDRTRCKSLMNAIEDLLYGIEIDQYLSLSLEAVAVLNDSVGGVTLQLPDDCTFLDESYVKDAVVTLRGEDALAYILEDGESRENSNQNRAQRQKQYFRALFAQIKGAGIDVSFKMLLDLKQYVSFGGTMSQMTGLLKRMKDCTFGGIESLEGEVIADDELREYRLDDQAARETVIRLFYTPVEK